MLNFSNKPVEDYSMPENTPDGNSLKDNRFSSKANGDQNGAENEPLTPSEVSVHAMPGKFLPSKPVKSSGSGSGRKILVFVAVFLFLAVAIVAGAYWYLNLPKVPEAQNNNQPIVLNQNENQNQNTNLNTNGNQNQNQNTNEEPGDNANANINENINDSPVPLLIESPDSDNDLLSYEEEIVFNTDSNSADSDKDGYKDGLELISLYNPLVPAQALVDSGLVTKFVNYIFSYSIIRPSSWLAQSVADDLGNIMILPNSESGELFTIYAMANENNWNLNQAKENLADILGAESFMQNYSLAGEPALRSIDQKKVLMVNKDYVYVIVYDSGGLPNGNFQTIFQMMLNSFELVPNE